VSFVQSATAPRAPAECAMAKCKQNCSGQRSRPWPRDGCRVQKLEAIGLLSAVQEWRPFFWKKEQGGASASVGWVGDRSRFQGTGVLGGGEHLPATAAAGTAASAAAASHSRGGSALLGAGVPLVHRLAKVVADRRTGHRLEVAPPVLASLLAMALKTEKRVALQ
jgi:hypothetical protein